MARCAGASARSGRSARSASEKGRLTTASRVWPSSRRWSAAARAAARSSIATTGNPGSAGPPWMITGSRRRTTASMIGSPSGTAKTTNASTAALSTSAASPSPPLAGTRCSGDPGAREPAQELDRRRVLEGVRERLAEHDAQHAGLAAAQRPRERVGTGVAELVGLREDPLAQLARKLLRAVVGVGHRHRRDAQRLGHGGQGHARQVRPRPSAPRASYGSPRAPSRSASTAASIAASGSRP